VCSDDEGRAADQSADQPCRNEEVRVDDVGVEPTRGLARLASKLEVLSLAGSAAVEDGTLHVVPACDELLFETANEYSETRIYRTGIHL
jgi:hypothetical protein